VQTHLYFPDSGQYEHVSLHLEAGLRVCHALVPARTLESGFTRLEACLTACKEAVVCVSDAFGDVLQYLRVYVRVLRVLMLQGWKEHVEGVL
jgi:hypothetical protein